MCLKFFFGFLSHPHLFSLSSPEASALFFHPHRISPFLDRSCVRRSTSGQAPTSATFTSCRISLEHRRAASNGHAHCRGLRVCCCSGHATASSSFLLLQSSSWSSKEGRSTSEGHQKFLREDRDPEPSPPTSCAAVAPRRSCQPPGMSPLNLGEAISSFKPAQINLSLNG